MTAYARASISSSLGHFSVELHCVNRKHLEINTSLPSTLLRYDSDIKKWISAVIGRGQVNVKILASFNDNSPLVVNPDLALAKQIKKAWEQISNELCCIISDEQLLEIISREEGLLIFDEEIADEELYKTTLQQLINEALKQLIAMKTYEGKVLYDDIQSRFAKLTGLISNIEVKAPAAIEKYRLRLEERLKEVLGINNENEERILREVFLYADRIDITEEIVRFKSHLEQVNKMLTLDLQANKHGISKHLEFFIQELNREVNTINSKASDVEISHMAIEIKTELEKIREQIQNIE